MLMRPLKVASSNNNVFCCIVVGAKANQTCRPNKAFTPTSPPWKTLVFFKVAKWGVK